MAYYYTLVPVQRSPHATYQAAHGLILKPAARKGYSAGRGATVFLDTIYFVSRAENEAEHVGPLKHWLYFHAFMFDDSWPIHLFETGQTRSRGPAESLGQAGRSRHQANAYAVDYNDVGPAIYFRQGSVPAASYSNLFDRYRALPSSDARLLRAYLFPLEPRVGMHPSLNLDLFAEMSRYWQVVSYVTILESTLGHPANCAENTPCPTCGKQRVHRAGTEREWRRQHFESIGMKEDVKGEYLRIIETAYSEIRHPTAHAGDIPVPQYIPVVGEETYDVTRSAMEFGTDMHALDSLIYSVRAVTRYLLLYRLFGLRLFPRLPTYHVKHISATATPLE